MKISNFTTIRPNMADTRTAEDFMKFLGAKPQRLGIMAKMYPKYTMIHLTEALGNTFYGEKSKTRPNSIDSFMVEWGISVSSIKRVAMTAEPEGDGANGSDVIFRFGENYYQRYDVFTCEDSRQQFIVMDRPVRVRDKEWVVTAKINDNDYSSVVDTSGAYPGATTRFVSTYAPELNEEGYTKYQSNVESHRTYIATHRVDIDASAQYLAMEDQFCTVAEEGAADVIYKLEPAKKVLLDSFMEAKNGAQLWGKSNIDENGHAKITTATDGRPVISSDGLIAQIERFAETYVFSKLSMAYFEDALTQMTMKSDSATGNTYTFICNTMLYQEFQRVGAAWLRDHRPLQAVVYGKSGENGKVTLGATYSSYEFAGNKVIIVIERALDIEFRDRKYGIFVDLTFDSATGKPGVANYTFKGGELIHNTVVGVGGLDGLSSGPVSSPVAGSKFVNFGYSGLAVFNPYRSVILKSHKIENVRY